MRDRPPSRLSIKREGALAKADPGAFLLPGWPSPSGLLARLNPGPKSHVEEAEGAGQGLHREGGSLSPARPRPLPSSSQPGQPPSHAMLSSASDARRGAPRFFFSTSRAKSKMRTKSTLKLLGPLPIPVVNGGRVRDCSPVPTPFDARTPPGADGSGKRDLARGASAASPSLWRGNWGRLTYDSPPLVPRKRKPHPTAPLCLQAGASLSESRLKG